MRLYFAIGGIVPIPPQALGKGTLAQALDLDTVFDFHSTQWKGRIAGLVAKPAEAVWGLAYQVTEPVWGELVRAEPGRRELEIKVAIDDTRRKAVALTTAKPRRTTTGPVSVAYLEALATFARTKRLPGAYVKRLTAEAMLVERVQRFGAQVKLPLGGSNAD